MQQYQQGSIVYNSIDDGYPVCTDCKGKGFRTAAPWEAFYEANPGHLTNPMPAGEIARWMQENGFKLGSYKMVYESDPKLILPAAETWICPTCKGHRVIGMPEHEEEGNAECKVMTFTPDQEGEVCAMDIGCLMCSG